MKCPKCEKKLYDDSIFCTGCGCNIEEAEKEIRQREEEERKKLLAMSASKETAQAEAPAKKSKTVIILLVLLIISLVGCAGVLLVTLDLQSRNIDFENEIAGYKTEISSLEANINEAEEAIAALEKERKELLEEKSYNEEILNIIASNDKWGYATENFHADRGIVVLERNESAKVNIYMSYYTSVYVGVTNDKVADVFWNTKEWVAKDSFVRIYAGMPGITTLEFTNDLYDTEFEILVIVKE